MSPPAPALRLAAGAERSRGPGTIRPVEKRSVAYDRRDRPALAGAVVLSVLLHALVVLIWPPGRISLDSSTSATPVAAASPTKPLTALAIRLRDVESAAPQPAEALPEPVPFEPRVPSIRRSPAAHGPRPSLKGATGRRPPAFLAAVPGAPEPTSPPGVSGGSLEPIALSILSGWKPRHSLHNVEILVRVQTGPAGRPTGNLQLIPRTPDEDLNRSIISRVLGLTYRPAVRDGRPVSAWAEISFVFCYKAISAASPARPSGSPEPCAARVEADSPAGDEPR